VRQREQHQALLAANDVHTPTSFLFIIAELTFATTMQSVCNSLQFYVTVCISLI